jgi:hypothetical protein
MEKMTAPSSQKHGCPWHTLWRSLEVASTGRNNLQAIEHLCTVGSDTERRGSTHFPHGLVCTMHVFAGMNLSWHVVELPVHFYFSILWENMYKKSYALICNEFIARIYFILFKKECPRMSVAAKKMISKVGHWYLDEHTTYIRVFRATRKPHFLPAHVPDRIIVGEICYRGYPPGL